MKSRPINYLLTFFCFLFVASCGGANSEPKSLKRGDELYDVLNSKLSIAIHNYDNIDREIIFKKFDSILNKEFFESLNKVEEINIKKFGAICDGIADDTEAFKSAFDLIKREKKGILFIPSGLCLVNPLQVPPNIVIYGEGKSSVLKLLPQTLNPAEHWAVLRAHGTKQFRVKNVHIMDLFIDGSKADHKGTPGSFHESITFDWGKNSTISGITIVNTIHNGIQIDGSRYVAIVNNTVLNADGWGIHLSDNGEGYTRRTENSLVINNFVVNSGYHTKRGGIDQNPQSRNNFFIGNLAKDNFKNYEIHNETALFKNNVSISQN